MGEPFMNRDVISDGHFHVYLLAGTVSAPTQAELCAMMPDDDLERVVWDDQRQEVGRILHKQWTDSTQAPPP